MNTDAKVLHKIPENRIEQYIKRTTSGIYPRMQGLFNVQ